MFDCDNHKSNIVLKIRSFKNTIKFIWQESQNFTAD